MAPDRNDLLDAEEVLDLRSSINARHRDRDHNGRCCGVIHGDYVEHDGTLKSCLPGHPGLDDRSVTTSDSNVN